MKRGRVARARELVERHRRPIGFLIVGGLNTVFGLSLYPLLLIAFPLLQRHYLWGLTIAQVVSIAFAYTMYKRTVFRTQGNWLRELWTFSSFYMLIYAVNLVALPLLVEGLRLSPIVAQLGFAVFTVVASYLWHSRLTFPAPR